MYLDQCHLSIRFKVRAFCMSSHSLISQTTLRCPVSAFVLIFVPPISDPRSYLLPLLVTELSVESSLILTYRALARFRPQLRQGRILGSPGLSRIASGRPIGLRSHYLSKCPREVVPAESSSSVWPSWWPCRDNAHTGRVSIPASHRRSTAKGTHQIPEGL